MTVGFRATGDIREFIGFGLLGAFLGILSVGQPRISKFTVGDGRTRVIIFPGDLLQLDCHKVIGVNEYFDCYIGDAIAPRSLHGQLILATYGGRADEFESDVDRALAQTGVSGDHSDLQDRPRYPIGTVAVIPRGAERIFLVALTHTDRAQQSKASANLKDLVTAWLGLWRAARTNTNGEPLCVPLLGDGQSDVGLSRTRLLHILLATLSWETSRNGRVCDEIRIVLRSDVYSDVDLRSLKA